MMSTPNPPPNSPYASIASGLLLLLLWMFLSLAPGCEGPMQSETTTDGSNLPETKATEPNNTTSWRTTTLQARMCPNKLLQTPKSAFTGTPCDANSFQNACPTSGCIPSTQPKDVATSSDFFKPCSTNPSVICVGKGRQVETLTAALAALKQDSTINKILIAKGLYKESVTFEGLQRSLTIEGESNQYDPTGTKGVVIEAPKVASPADTYAALRFVKVPEITLTRLAVAGAGHGVFIEGSRSVIINNDHLTANLRSGLWLKDNDKVEITQTRIIRNGATQQDGVYQALHIGLMVENTKGQVLLKNNEIAHNGSGGALITGPNRISVIINNDHRVVSDTISVIINNDHRPVLEGNHVHHNGPLGFAGYPKESSSCKCNKTEFCEGNVCHRELISAGNQAGYVGFGVAISDAKAVVITGNSFFANDTTGLMVSGVNTLTLSENSITRNGVRPHADNSALQAFAHPAADLRGVASTLSLTHNIILDNVGTGIKVRHQLATTDLALRVGNNHFGGNSRFAAGENVAGGDGLNLDTIGGKAAIDLNASDNQFSDNRRAGITTKGPLKGTLKDNLLAKHPFRAIVIQDTGTNKNNSINLTNNSIDGASGYGIQIYGGAATLNITNNQIRNLQTINNATNAEADGINLTDLSSQVTVKGNLLQDNTRAGVFVSGTNTKVVANNNQIATTQFPIVTQKGTPVTNVTGQDSKLAKEAQSTLPNSKDF